MNLRRKPRDLHWIVLAVLLLAGCGHQQFKTADPGDSEISDIRVDKPALEGRLTLDRLQVVDKEAAESDSPGVDETGEIPAAKAPEEVPSLSETAGDVKPKALFAPGMRASRMISDAFASERARESGGKAGDIVFNFDDADLYEVIRTMAELLGINYMVDPGIRGRVTIQTAGKLNEDELFDVFFQILEANNLTAVREGSLYKIVPLKDAPRMQVPERYGRTGKALPPGERMIMQIIPLDHIDAQEMTKLLTPFISAQGTIISHGDSNTLLVVDKDVNVMKALKLVRAFDVDIFQNVSHRFYTVQHVEAEEMVGLLQEILTAYGKTDKDGVKLIAINRMNGIMVIAPDPTVFPRVEGFIRDLDTPNEIASPRIYVYSVKNGEAEDLSDLLGAVFGSETATAAATPKESENVTIEKEERPSNPFAPPNPFGGDTPKRETPGTRAAAVRRATETEGSGTLRGEMRITPDPVRNALIIEALPSDYRIIQGILERLDVLPRQVLIEVIIAEVSLDGTDELGVEWTYQKGSGGSISASLLDLRAGSAGLQYTIGETGRWDAKFSALTSQNKVNVLSAPLILASDNKEAKINVSTQVPVASAEYTFDSGVSGVTQTNIQYRNTGIIMSVTPHINERGLVNMDISQEVSEEGGGVDIAGQNFPSFRERRVQTTLTVRHGQTIVMGGLMTRSRDGGKSGVPVLSRIPGIGFLFGRESRSYEKRELVLLITPRVIVNLEDIDTITEEFKFKVGRIRDRIG